MEHDGKEKNLAGDLLNRGQPASGHWLERHFRSRTGFGGLYCLPAGAEPFPRPPWRPNPRLRARHNYWNPVAGRHPIPLLAPGIDAHQQSETAPTKLHVIPDTHRADGRADMLVANS